MAAPFRQQYPDEGNPHTLHGGNSCRHWQTIVYADIKFQLPINNFAAAELIAKLRQPL